LRVLLATDRPSLGAALSLFLTERNVEVVGVVGQALDVLTRAQASHADVVVIDRRLGDAAIEEAVAELRDHAGHASVVVLGPTQDGASIGLLGADGFAVLGDPPDALLAVMREVSPAIT
jgi:DNA-binding NarL/FixJ family response regulator